MVSVVILTSEPTKIPKITLDSISFAEEILYTPINDNFSAARNAGLQKAKHDWVLYIDSDEVVSSELAQEITTLITNNQLLIVQAYNIPRRDFFWGHELKYGETHKARTNGIIRLIKKGSGRWVGKVHEVFETDQKIGRLHGFIDHHPHQTIAAFLTSINEYSTIRAGELQSMGIDTNVFQIVLYPFVKFWYTYLFKLGFLDGPAGFVYSFMMSFHSFLVRAKLYLLYHLEPPRF